MPQTYQDVLDRLSANDSDLQDVVITTTENNGLCLLMQALEKNTHLKSLSFANICLTEDDLAALVKIIETNTTIISLSLQHIPTIDYDDQASLIKAIENNKTLERLVLRDVRLVRNTSNLIFKMLEINQTLRWLDVSNNPNMKLAPGEIPLFFEMLSNNTALEHFYIDGNSLLIMYDEREVLEKVFSKNYTFLQMLKSDFRLQQIDFSEEDRFLYPLLKACFIRNRRINDRLVEMRACYRAGNLLTNHELISRLMEELPALVPALTVDGALPKNHPIAEAYRLLTSIAYLFVPPQINHVRSFELLRQPFNDIELQEAANVVMAHLLFLSHELFIDEKASEAQQIIRYQLIWGGLKPYLHQPRTVEHNILKYAFAGLKSPLTQPSPEVSANIEMESFLFYKDILLVAAKALKDRPKEHDFERNLLTLLLEQSEYSAIAMKYFLLSPAFLKLFKDSYPNLNKIIIFENCLVSPDVLVFNLPEINKIKEVNALILRACTAELKAAVPNTGMNKLSMLNDISNIIGASSYCADIVYLPVSTSFKYASPVEYKQVLHAYLDAQIARWAKTNYASDLGDIRALELLGQALKQAYFKDKKEKLYSLFFNHELAAFARELRVVAEKNCALGIKGLFFSVVNYKPKSYDSLMEIFDEGRDGYYSPDAAASSSSSYSNKK